MLRTTSIRDPSISQSWCTFAYAAYPQCGLGPSSSCPRLIELSQWFWWLQIRSNAPVVQWIELFEASEEFRLYSNWCDVIHHRSPYVYKEPWIVSLRQLLLSFKPGAWSTYRLPFSSYHFHIVTMVQLALGAFVVAAVVSVQASPSPMNGTSQVIEDSMTKWMNACVRYNTFHPSTISES